MKVFVTGAAGFIGFHLARRLLAEGHDVLGYDGVTDYYDVRLKRERLAQLKKSPSFHMVEAMLEEKSTLQRAVDGFKPNMVVHLAAQAGVRYSLDHPDAYVSGNLVGTYNLLETLRRQRPEHFLFAATSSVYGGNEQIPFRETDRTDFPVSLYAATKKAGEAMAHSYSHLFDIPTTCFRFFTVYGPWGRPDMALFKFVRAIRAGEPIDVYGHGRMARDFTYIDDLIDGITGLMDKRPVTRAPVSMHDSLSPVAPFRVVNIAGGSSTGLMEYIAAIEAATGLEAKKNLLPLQPGDVYATSADPSLLEAITGRKPGTPVAAGVGRFVEWYDQHYAGNTA